MGALFSLMPLGSVSSRPTSRNDPKLVLVTYVLTATLMLYSSLSSRAVALALPVVWHAQVARPVVAQLPLG